MKKTRLFTYLVIIFAFIYNPFTVKLLCKKYAKKYSLESSIFIKQIKAESSLWSFAKSKTGNIGLGQVHPNTANFMVDSGFHKLKLYLPWYNLNISAKYMNYLLNKYNHNYSLSLAAYNWGEGNVDKLIKNTGIVVDESTNFTEYFFEIKETYYYLQKILTKE